jgi:hypothetical protein
VDPDQVHQRRLGRPAATWISDAEVAEISYTAFTSKAKAKHVTARLIVRRVKDMNPDHQSELFTAYRYHAVFTDSPLPMLEAEKAHRAHAIVEQVIADLKNGPLAHLPDVISSRLVDHAADLQFCVVDGVVDGKPWGRRSAWADQFRPLLSGRVAAVGRAADGGRAPLAEGLLDRVP